MAKLKYIKSKLSNSPIKSLSQLNLILDGNIGNITDFKLIYNSKNRGGVRIYQYLKNIELDHE